MDRRRFFQNLIVRSVPVLFKTRTIPIFVIFFLICLFGSSSGAYATIETLHADGAGANNQWTGVTQANLADNDGDTSYAEETTENERMYATVANTALAEGRINSVTVKGYFKAGDVNDKIILGMYDGTNLIENAGTAPGTSYDLLTYSSTTNPTGGTWIWSDVNSLQATAKAVVTGGSGGLWRCTEFWIEVDYVLPISSFPYSQGFEGTFPPDSWGHNQWEQKATPHDGSYSAGASIDTIGDDTRRLFVYVDFSDQNNVSLSFWQKATVSDMGDMRVIGSINSTDGVDGDWFVLKDWFDPATDWTEETTFSNLSNFDNQSNSYIKIQAKQIGESSFTLYIDDVTIDVAAGGVITIIIRKWRELYQ